MDLRLLSIRSLGRSAGVLLARLDTEHRASGSKSIQGITVARCGLDARSLPGLGQFVNRHQITTVRKLRLSGNAIDEHCLVALASLLRACPEVQSLWMDENPIQGSGIAAIISVSCSGIQVLARSLRAKTVRQHGPKVPTPMPTSCP